MLAIGVVPDRQVLGDPGEADIRLGPAQLDERGGGELAMPAMPAVALLGDGNDTFVWNPGDDSDIVEGQGGTNTLQFNGSNIGENMDLSANGPRLRLTRDVGNIVMDVDGVEHVRITAAGGADTITVNDLSGTAVTQVALDLSAPAGVARVTGRRTR